MSVQTTASPPRTVAETSAVGGGSGGALGSHRPALDGLRAMSMVVVLAYHAQIPLAKGAFLGISQFFTLSGFLITSLLLRARGPGGGIELRTFWARRYRRLLPASFLTLAGVIVFGATIATEQQLDALPGSVAAALAQVANWYFVLTEQSYVALFSAPSPVQHFWSLAVEEQFYLLFPLGLLVLWRISRSLKVTAVVLGLGVLASSGLMLFLYDRGATLDRLYYGTDTRAAELLVGAVLAVVLHAVPLRVGRLGRWLLAAVGFASLVAIVWGWGNVALTDRVLWRGGFLVFAVLSATLIVAVLDDRGPVARLFAFGPLPAIGRITYGLYLFHWPIYLWLTEERTGLDLWPLFAVRLAATFVVAIASYHLLEMPVRTRRWRGRADRLGWLLAPAALCILAGTYGLTQREVTTDLAGLGQPVAAAPVTGPRTDDVLDLLVVADEGGAPVGRLLDAIDDDRDDLAVTVAPPFTCDEVDDSGRRPVCTNWRDEWPELVASVDPDAVLLQVSAWHGPPLDELAGTADLYAKTMWSESLLHAGFDLLTEQGATVVWNEGPTTLEEGIRRKTDPFSIALLQVTSGRTDTRRLQNTDQDIHGVLADLELYQRTDHAGDLPRVLVVGDSSARTLGYGLERWADRESTAIVWASGTEGCGIADEGIVHETTGREQPYPERCRSVADDWEEQIEQFDPDAVVVLSTMFDLQERRLVDWPGFLRPGDERFDDYLVAEYVDAFDTLSAGGARVLWLRNPCARAVIGTLADDDGKGPLDTDRILHNNEVILGRLARERPAVRFFDMFGVLCPDGSFVDRLGSSPELRPDGVHFSAEGSTWFAEHHGQAILDAALG